MNPQHSLPSEPGTPLDDGLSGTSPVDLARHPLRRPRMPNRDSGAGRDSSVEPDRPNDDPDPVDPTDSGGDTLGGGAPSR